MLIDTGAALTTFTLRVIPTLDTDSRITINMAKGSVLASRLSVGFVLGESDLREGHCSFHQNVVVGAFKFLDADGLVGQDVLSHFKSVTFDFKSPHSSWKPPNRPTKREWRELRGELPLQRWTSRHCSLHCDWLP
jgi:hypothetical protein